MLQQESNEQFDPSTTTWLVNCYRRAEDLSNLGLLRRAVVAEKSNDEDDELLVALLSHIIRLHATIDAFAMICLRLQLGKNVRQHPALKSFVKLQSDLVISFISTLSVQFPDLAKVITDQVEVSLDDLHEDLTHEDEDRRGAE